MAGTSCRLGFTAVEGCTSCQVTEERQRGKTMENRICLKDLKKILMDGVMVRKWNDSAGCHEILFQTESIETCDIPDKFLDMEVCGIGTYLDCDMNYVSVELE